MAQRLIDNLSKAWAVASSRLSKHMVASRKPSHPKKRHLHTIRSDMKSQRTVHLIDALPYVFRAYHSLPSGMTDESGRQKNAVVGFTNFLVNYIRVEQPTHMALCFDRSLTKCFR